jgi:hypothetical protein
VEEEEKEEEEEEEGACREMAWFLTKLKKEEEKQR